ncbi:uncharacterized protein phldb1b [Syngnathus typhle]
MEKARLIEFREQESLARHQMEEEWKRGEAEKRLQDETLHQLQLGEKELKFENQELLSDKRGNACRAASLKDTAASISPSCRAGQGVADMTSMFTSRTV